MSFDGGDEFSRLPQPTGPNDIESAFKELGIEYNNKAILTTVFNAISTFESFDDLMIKLESYLSTKIPTIVNDATWKDFVNQQQLDAMADDSIDDFLAVDYNRDLDHITHKVAASTRTPTPRIITGPGDLSSPLKQPSHNTKLTTATTLSTPSTTATKRANAYRNETPQTSGANNRRRSNWTPLLASPSTAFPEHHQKGQVLVRFAPTRSKDTVGGNSLTSLHEDKSSSMQMSQSTRMFDAVDSATKSPTSPSSTSPPIVPVFVLSWIEQAITARKKQKEAQQKGLYVAQNVVDPDDPLKTSSKPFRYMDWNHRTALQTAVDRESGLVDEFRSAQAYMYGLQTLAGMKAKKMAMAAAQRNGSTPIKAPQKPTTTADPDNQLADDDDGDDDLLFVEDFSRQQMTDAWYAGHIKNTLSSKDSRLSSSTLILSNYRSECSLKLTHKSLQHYSFFPGQVILCRATNITGNTITPDLILTESTIPNYSRRRWIGAFWSLVHSQNWKKQSEALSAKNSMAASAGPARKSLFLGAPETTTTTKTTTPTQPLVPSVEEVGQVVSDRPVKVVYCNGPYVSAKGKTQSLAGIFDHISDELNVPDVLILSGPFIDIEAPGSLLRPTHMPNATQLEIQPEFYQRKAGEVGKKMDEEMDEPKNEKISLCNVPVFKSDVFSKYKATIPPSPAQQAKMDDGEEGKKAGEVEMDLFQDLFSETMAHIMKTLNSNPLTQNITVITIPSTRDVHHYPCFPQPGYEWKYNPTNPYDQNSVKLINAPNPCQLDINGVVFAATTQDVLAELSRYELFVQKQVEDNYSLNNVSVNPSTPSKASPNTSTPSKLSEFVQLGSPTSPSTMLGSKNGVCAKDKRTVRLISHILSQQSFAPIPTLNANDSLENTRTGLDLIFKPDILLLPSKLRHFIEPIPMPGQLSSNQTITDPTPDFIKQHGHVLAINPSSTIQGESLGSFAAITIYNKDDQTAMPAPDERIDIIDRVNAEIIHL